MTVDKSTDRKEIALAEQTQRRIYRAEMTRTGEKQKTRQEGQEAIEEVPRKQKRTGETPKATKKTKKTIRKMLHSQKEET